MEVGDDGSSSNGDDEGSMEGYALRMPGEHFKRVLSKSLDMIKKAGGASGGSCRGSAVCAEEAARGQREPVRATGPEPQRLHLALALRLGYERVRLLPLRLVSVAKNAC